MPAGPSERRLRAILAYFPAGGPPPTQSSMEIRCGNKKDLVTEWLSWFCISLPGTLNRIRFEERDIN